MTAQTIIHDQLFLKQKSAPATKNDVQIATDLLDTLVANKDRAAGLAANMIGKSKRIIALYVGPFPIVMVNPVITKKSGKYTASEGCLSLSGERNTPRYQNITVRYQNKNFDKKEQAFNGFIAEVIQHEIDHCNGILI